jgi:chemotaxis protein methyltransferase CheR
MTHSIEAGDVERFRAALGRRLGLLFDETRRGLLAEVLRRRLDQVRMPAELYVRNLDIAAGPAECAALARELTVGETYFFRNREQFRALAEIALPERMRANMAARTLRLLSAGCASGEEAYSLAIVLREAGVTAGWDSSVRAVDINPAALEKAAGARYSSWALRETSAETRDRWFQAAGRDLLLDPVIRDAVRFDERNLAADDGELWRPRSLDIVFCRNVVMYFAPEQARALIARIAAALQPGGYLFLGHAETLRGLSDDFHLRHTHGTFYYQRKGDARQAALPARASPGRFAASCDPPAAAVGDGWVDVIREASARVAVLASGSAASQKRAAPSSAPDLVGVLDLLRRERFAEALALLRSLSRGGPQDPDMLLLEATLLANSRLLPAAEETCLRLLAVDELNAAAHYVLALCRESAGDLSGSAEQDRVAAYLDPGFAMPWLHLGLLARRAGDRAGGQRELTHALVLLKREDASRLLLFGGGFSRDALLGLCESALRDCGSPA